MYVQLKVLPIPAFAAGLAAIGMLLWLQTSKGKPVETRLAIFAGFALLKGMSLGDLMNVILHVDPSIAIEALLYTSAAFACFSGFAIFSGRRSQLYLGAILSSIMSWMLIGALLNLFFRSAFLSNVSLYGGLVLFLGWIVVDSQLMIERAASAGASYDYIGDATSLYIDFVVILCRVAIILLKNRGNNGTRKNSRR